MPNLLVTYIHPRPCFKFQKLHNLFSLCGYYCCFEHICTSLGTQTYWFTLFIISSFILSRCYLQVLPRENESSLKETPSDRGKLDQHLIANTTPMISVVLSYSEIGVVRPLPRAKFMWNLRCWNKQVALEFCYCDKKIDVSSLCVFPLPRIDHEMPHDTAKKMWIHLVIKVPCGSTSFWQCYDAFHDQFRRTAT